MSRRDRLAWHREQYNVPARRGMRCTIDDRPGVIIGAEGPWVKVRLDEPYNGRKIVVTHPLVHIAYLPAGDDRG